MHFQKALSILENAMILAGNFGGNLGEIDYV